MNATEAEIDSMVEMDRDGTMEAMADALLGDGVAVDATSETIDMMVKDRNDFELAAQSAGAEPITDPAIAAALDTMVLQPPVESIPDEVVKRSILADMMAHLLTTGTAQAKVDAANEFIRLHEGVTLTAMEYIDAIQASGIWSGVTASKARDFILGD